MITRIAIWGAIFLFAVHPCFADPIAEPEVQIEASDKLVEGHSAISRWQFGKAVQIAESIDADDADENERLFLARVHFYKGEYVKALEFLESLSEETIAASKPIMDFAPRLRAAWEITRDFERKKTEHFEVRWKKGKDEILVDYALETLEAAAAAYEQDLGWVPNIPVIVEIAPSTRELAELTGVKWESLKTSGTIAICKYNKLMVLTPRVLPMGYSWRDTMSHELSHQAISQVSHNQVPIWLHEGLAKYLEVRWRQKTGNRLSASTETLLSRALSENKLLTFDQMHPSMAYLPSQEHAALAYAEVLTVVQWLEKKGGRHGLRNLLEKLYLNKGDMDKSLTQAYRMDLKKLETLWKKDLRNRRLKQYDGVFDDWKKIFEKRDEPSEDSEFAKLGKTKAKNLTTIGKLLRDRGHKLAAQKEFEKAQKLIGDTNLMLQNYLAEQYLETGKYAKAEQALKNVSRLYSGYTPTFIRLARAEISQQKYEAANESLNTALGLNIFDPRVHSLLVEVYRALQQPALMERAKAHLELVMQR